MRCLFPCGAKILLGNRSQLLCQLLLFGVFGASACGRQLSVDNRKSAFFSDTTPKAIAALGAVGQRFVPESVAADFVVSLDSSKIPRNKVTLEAMAGPVSIAGGSSNVSAEGFGKWAVGHKEFGASMSYGSSFF